MTHMSRTMVRANLPLRVVQAGPGDAARLAPLFDAYRSFYRRPRDPAGARRFLFARLSRRESKVYIAVKGAARKGAASSGSLLHQQAPLPSKMGERGRSALPGAACLGFVQLYPSFSSVSMKRLWVLNDLFVVPGARRRGAAEALMARARRLALETGAEGLVLETAVDNKKAQRLYEKLGWKRDREFYRYNLDL